MPRTYKRKNGAQPRKYYDEEIMNKAVAEVREGKETQRNIAKKYNINFKTLSNRARGYSKKKSGGQLALPVDLENKIVENLIICAEWGYPCNIIELAGIIEDFLNKKNVIIKKFKNNRPGADFIRGFLKRHKENLTVRFCNNIRKCRAEISPELINAYFDCLENSIRNVPPSNIVNYDETNFQDDPGKRKGIVKRGTKKADQIMNSSKTAISVMFAGTANGTLLPPYVVYKAKHLYDSWTSNGPNKCYYNRSSSGWFDATIFEDWARKVAVPHMKKLQGKKVLIGDNLSSHFNVELIEFCLRHDIHFIFLPKNATHLTQPLDVAVFAPLKRKWKEVLLDWKHSPDGKQFQTLPKSKFPQLLNKVIIETKDNISQNLQSGFKKTGIVPLNRHEVLSQVPGSSNTIMCTFKEVEILQESFVSIMKSLRYHTSNNATQARVRRKRINVQPGQSISLEISDDSMDNIPLSELREILRNNNNK